MFLRGSSPRRWRLAQQIRQADGITQLVDRPAASSGHPLFVVGFARSGTTLMRVLLNDHPDQAIAPETHFLDEHVASNGDADLDDPRVLAQFWGRFRVSPGFARLGLDADAFVGIAGPDAFRDVGSLFRALLVAHAEKQGKSRIGEKTPDHYRYLGTLFDWFPDARVIFMIRDPRAVVASFLHVGESWAAGADAYVVARDWAAHLAHLDRWRLDPRVLVMRYEHLVRDPEVAVKEALDFAELSPEVDVIVNRRPTEQEDNGSLGALTRVSDENIDAWRSRLSRRQVAIVEGAIGSRLEDLGHEPAASRALGRIQVAVERIRHTPGRLVRR